jgi:hypothetical protein
VKSWPAVDGRRLAVVELTEEDNGANILVAQLW